MLNEASREEVEMGMKCYTAFMFALKTVAVGTGRDFTQADYHKIWEVVNEVADGNQTLNVSPAELQAQNPEMVPAMRRGIQEAMQRTIHAEQEMAVTIRRASGGFVTRPG